MTVTRFSIRLFQAGLLASLRALGLAGVSAALLFSGWMSLQPDVPELPLAARGWLALLSLPILAPMLIPLGALAGTLLVLEELATPPHAQLLPSLGCGPRCWTSPLLLSALLIALLGIGSGLTLEPSAWRAARLLLLDAEGSRLSRPPTDGAHLERLGPDWLLVRTSSGALTLLARPDTQTLLWLSSAQAQLKTKPQARTLEVSLTDGRLMRARGDSPLTTGQFSSLSLKLPLETTTGKRSLAELTPLALLMRVDQEHRRGRPGALETLTLHRRIASPLCAVSFCLLACGLRARLRPGRLSTLTGAGLTLLAWYASQRASDGLAVGLPAGGSGPLLLAVLAWSPVLVPSLLGSWLLRRAERRL